MIATSNDAGSNGDGPLSHAVLGFEATLKRLVKAAGEPGFTPAGWAISVSNAYLQPKTLGVFVDTAERISAAL